MNIKKGP